MNAGQVKMESAEPQTALKGWDAVLAIDAANLNELLFHQYLEKGPDSADIHFSLAAQDDQDIWLVNVVLGPPQISFSAGNTDNQQCTVSMEMIRGVVVKMDPNSSVVKAVLHVTRNQAEVTGEINLRKIRGTVTNPNSQLGSVVIDLAGGAFTPRIAGIDPKSELAMELGKAFGLYFAANDTTYALGGLTESNVPDCLQPTDFVFYCQKAGENDGCVVLLIRTNGSTGDLGDLKPYPIEEGYTTGLYVSSEVLFGKLFPPFLSKNNNSGISFSGKQISAGNWVTVAHSGTLSVMVKDEDTDSWSSDSNGYEMPVNMNLSGLTVRADGTNLSVYWEYKWKQYWTRPYPGHIGVDNTQSNEGTASYSLTATPSVDTVTDIITFSGKGAASYKPYKADFWEKFFGKMNVSDILKNTVENSLQNALEDIQLPSVNVFALENLLFPASHTLHVEKAALPGHLYAAGRTKRPVAVEPAVTPSIMPGTSVQLGATGHSAGDFLWSVVAGGVGTISDAGLYTAPAVTGAAAQPVVISAVLRSDTKQEGRALIVVTSPAAASGLQVEPESLMVTPGQTFMLRVADAAGNPVKADCTLSSPVGTLRPALQQGEWIYTAPALLEDGAAERVIFKAVSCADKTITGQSSITVVPTTAVSVTSSSATISKGGQVSVTADANAGTDPLWFVLPTGRGTITANPEDRTKAVYTAPVSITPADNQVIIGVYAGGMNFSNSGFTAVSIEG